MDWWKEHIYDYKEVCQNFKIEIGTKYIFLESKTYRSAIETINIFVDRADFLIKYGSISINVSYQDGRKNEFYNDGKDDIKLLFQKLDQNLKPDPSPSQPPAYQE